MKSHAADKLLRRMEAQATALGDFSSFEFEDCRYPGEPRWRIDARWIEFECGCRAERCMVLRNPKPWDPIIFKDLPEQAVYDYVCHFHEPHMNKRVFLGRDDLGVRFVTFKDWHQRRRNLLMGR